MIETSGAAPKAALNGQPAVSSAVEENLYLTGRPTLKDFLRFVQHRAIDPPDAGALVDEWQAAVEIVARIETAEAGIADHPVLQKLGPEYDPLLIELFKDPIIQNSFNTVPTQVALIELDHLIVYQKYIDVTHTRRLEQKLGPAPDRETVFRTCLPYDHPSPPATWAQTSGNTFTFLSPSRDFRYLGASQLEPSQITNFPPPGDTVGIAGFAVGFGSNFLNAIYAENRLILNNGSHRAYALRRLGVTHVPCIVQHVPSREALNVVATREIRQNADYFYRHPRPSMLKDYFDARVHKVMEVQRRLRQITLKVEVTESYIPAM